MNPLLHRALGLPAPRREVARRTVPELLDAAAAVLGAHRPRGPHDCMCGWWAMDGTEIHARHVAAALFAAGLLNPQPPVPGACPRCGRVSHNPNDIREGYCGACHDWTSIPGATS